MDRETMPQDPSAGAVKDLSARAAAAGRRNLTLLTICQFLYYMGMGIDLTLTAVVGLRLAPTPVLATLPITLMGAAAMIANFSAGLLSDRFGHRKVAAGGAATAVAGGLVSMAGIRSGDFSVLCTGTALVGLYKATGGYFRYLAADSVPRESRERAVSVLLCGGVLAAFVGPWAATACAGLMDTEYAGSYLLVSVLAAAVIPPVLAVRSGPAGEEQEPSPPPVRIRAAARTLQFRTAFATLTVGGCVMTLLMSAGPLGSRHAGHSDGVGAFVIQAHMVGMFAPSLFSGWLNTALGPRRNAVLGAALLAAGALVGAADTGVAAFVVALSLVGVGWNFLYVAGSTFVVRCYPPHAGGRVQAAVEGGTGIFLTASSFVSGYLFTTLGWQVLSTLAALPPLLLCLWLSTARRVAGPEEKTG
ncbi:MFS transporter [Streptomyces argenteolus]|uniref:MFS transporter n=1 Tax=Streptomyces argenteolus TaxID=67274 RepID=A0ABW6X6P4_9ACTN